MPAKTWNNYDENYLIISNNTLTGHVKLTLDLDAVDHVKRVNKWWWCYKLHRCTCSIDGNRVSLQRYLWLHWRPTNDFGSIRMIGGPCDFRRQSLLTTFRCDYEARKAEAKEWANE